MRYFTVAITNNSLVKALEELDDSVNERINNGWRPLGGVCVIKTKDCDAYYVIQAMSKE